MLINSTLEVFFKMTHLYTDLLFIAGYRLGLPINVPLLSTLPLSPRIISRIWH